MTQPQAPRPSGPAGTFTPTWWLVLAWAAMLVATVWSVERGRWGLDQVGTRVLAGCLFAVAAIAFRAGGDRNPVKVRVVGVVGATVAGLLVVLLAPAGLGEVPVFVSASRIPFAFPERGARLFTAASTIATAATVGYVSHSLAGAMAGAGIPLLAQRALDRRRLIDERDRAQALLVEVEAARDAESQAAALRERGRIAREMHDVLAHSLAGLSLQLQALRAVAQKEGASPAILEPLDRAAALARDGLAEAKSAVGALSDSSLRGVAEIEDLVRNHPGDVSLSATGTPEPLTSKAGHAAYRAVQESLTNAARYAPGSAVAVTLSWSSGTLTVQVDDTGAAPGHSSIPGQGTGLGLSGMRQRLADVGGTASAGPHGNGWRVAATIPTRVPSHVPSAVGGAS